LFLDEVQRIEGWDKFVRRVLDSEKMSVHITGSSSKLLSKEIATSLRGRSLTTEIFPFSFKEFLGFHNIRPKSTERFGSKTRALLENRIGQYLEIGGFPEIQSFPSELRREVLQNYLDVVILRDVVERHTIRNTVALRAMIRHVMSAPATRFSVNKFYNSLKSRGISCTKNNLYDYLDHLVDAFVFYQVPIHSRSERARQVNPSKIYVVDTGLLEAMSLRMTEDRGALLENLVYMQLRKQGMNPEYYLTKSGAEVDFILTGDSRRKRQLIQVCWTTRDPSTQEREVGSLLAAMKELGMKHGTLVTWLNEEISDDRIDVVPAWKWLLRG
jgi:predicted AAA+ superfamily ATPase